MTAVEETAEAPRAPAEPPVTLTEMWRHTLTLLDDAAWWRREADERVLGGMLRLIDACAYAQEGKDRHEGSDDKRLVRRLAEIARDRDVLKGYAPARRPLDPVPA